MLLVVRQIVLQFVIAKKTFFAFFNIKRIDYFVLVDYMLNIFEGFRDSITLVIKTRSKYGLILFKKYYSVFLIILEDFLGLCF